MKKTSSSQPDGNLRHQAEQRLHQDATISLLPATQEDAQALVYELQVYQIELEMQNEELRRAQVELTALGARYRELHDFAPVGYLTLDSRGRILEANLMGASLLGIGRRDLIKKRFSAFLSLDSQADYRLLVQRLQETGVKQTCKFSSLESHGTVRNLQAEALITEEAVEADRQIRLAILDVTEQKQMELARQQSDAQMAIIISSAMDAIITIDEAQRIVLFNEAAAQMFRCPVVKALGQPIDRFIPERFRRMHAGYIQAFGRTGITNRSMSSLSPVYGLRGDGEEFPVEATISQVEIAGSPLYTVIIRDITERKRAERTAQLQTSALIQTLKAFKTLPETDGFLKQVLTASTQALNAISASLWLYDKEQNTLSLYLEYEEGRYLTGAQSDHPGAINRLSVQTNPYWAKIAGTHQSLLVDLTAEVDVPNREWFLDHDFQSLLIVPMLLGDETIGCISIRSAITPQYRQAEIELAQALTQQATLAVQMSRLAEQGRQAAILHERNRMAQEIHDTLAQGFTGILRQLEAATYAPKQEQMQLHIAQARDLARHSLQEARRSVRAMRPQTLESEHLPGALAHLIQLSTLDITARTKYQLEGTPYPLLQEVEDHLFRICQEALTNAIKHAEATEIEVELSFEPAQVRLHIRDTGKGFDVEAGVEGNGFGLIGMYERAEHIGGQMTLTTHLGQGTSILVTVPMTPYQPNS